MTTQWQSIKRSSLHITLFIFTFFTTTLAGVQWLNRDPLELSNFAIGLPFSLSVLAILTTHEFGHFFAARYHAIETTLPFYIPIPPFLLNPFGTMGAVIRIKSPITTRRALFDIGIAGPIAGFIVTLGVLLYGYATLPGIEYIFTIHPEYLPAGIIPHTGLAFGHSLLTMFLEKVFSLRGFVPPMNEIYHYPYLCAGWFGLFITAVNLIPVGQLDGGHITYALTSRRQGLISRIVWGILILTGLTSLLPIPAIQFQPGAMGWLIWAALLFFVIKLDHPQIIDPLELSPGRKILGWVMIAVFVLTFPPIPFLEYSGG